MSIKILLADDHGIVRQGMRLILEQENDLTVAGEASDGREALELVRKLMPDIVIMDIAMPNLNGIDAASRIVSEFPGIKVIALSIHSSNQYVTEMLKAGASGYLAKECLSDELVLAIRTVSKGNIYLNPKVAASVVSEYMGLNKNAGKCASQTLTSREREILQLIAEGRSTKQVALELNLSNKTVEAARRRIMDKLNINSVAELTKYAIEKGITSVDI